MSDIRNDILRAEWQGARKSREIVGPGATTKQDLMRVKQRSPWKKGQSPVATALKRTGIMQTPITAMKQRYFGG